MPKQQSYSEIVAEARWLRVSAFFIRCIGVVLLGVAAMNTYILFDYWNAAKPEQRTFKYLEMDHPFWFFVSICVLIVFGFL